MTMITLTAGYTDRARRRVEELVAERESKTSSLDDFIV